MDIDEQIDDCIIDVYRYVLYCFSLYTTDVYTVVLSLLYD